MKRLVQATAVAAVLGAGFIANQAELSGDVVPASSNDPAALDTLGPVQLVSGAYGCDDGADDADAGSVGGANNPVCHFGNFSVPDAQAECEARGPEYRFIGNTTTGGLSNADVTVSHSAKYLNISFNGAFEVVDATIKAGSNHNHYVGDTVGLHGPVNNGGNIANISHWTLCYRPSI